MYTIILSQTAICTFILKKPNSKQILLNRSFGNNTLLVLYNDEVTSEALLCKDDMN